MTDTHASIEEKARRLQDAYDAFMRQMNDLEHDRLEVMRRVMGDLEREEIEGILNDLKRT